MKKTKIFLGILLLTIVCFTGCGDKNPIDDTELHSAETPSESGISDIYRQGATELPRNELDGEPEFFLSEDEEGNPIVIPNTDAGGEVLDGTAEDHMMVDDNGENAE